MQKEVDQEEMMENAMEEGIEEPNKRVGNGLSFLEPAKGESIEEEEINDSIEEEGNKEKVDD